MCVCVRVRAGVHSRVHACLHAFARVRMLLRVHAWVCVCVSCFSTGPDGGRTKTCLFDALQRLRCQGCVHSRVNKGPQWQHKQKLQQDRLHKRKLLIPAINGQVVWLGRMNGVGVDL